MPATPRPPTSRAKPESKSPCANGSALRFQMYRNQGAGRLPSWTIAEVRKPNYGGQHVRNHRGNGKYGKCDYGNFAGSRREGAGYQPERGTAGTICRKGRGAIRRRRIRYVGDEWLRALFDKS